MPAGEEVRKNALVLARVRRVQRRLNAEVWLNAAVAPAWAAATGIALFRLVVRQYTPLAAVALALAGLALWTWRARRRLVPLSSAAVIADRQSGAGGLLLTRLEGPLGEWELTLNDRVRQV